MTTPNLNPESNTQTRDTRREHAKTVYTLLRESNVKVGLRYNDKYTVNAGPVTACFTSAGTKLIFFDPYVDRADLDLYDEWENFPFAVVSIPFGCTLGVIVAVIKGLLTQLAVTS